MTEVDLKVIKLSAVYNKKFRQWRICHDQWCDKGDTSIVASITTSGDFDNDRVLALEICRRWNSMVAAQADLAEAQKVIEHYASGLRTLATTFYKEDQHQTYAQHILEANPVSEKDQ